MKEIKAIIQPFMLERVLQALDGIEDLPGVTVSHVLGWGRSRGDVRAAVEREGDHAFARKTQIEVIVADRAVASVTAAIVQAAHTGRPGDGKIFVSNVLEIIKNPHRRNGGGRHLKAAAADQWALSRSWRASS